MSNTLDSRQQVGNRAVGSLVKRPSKKVMTLVREAPDDNKGGYPLEKPPYLFSAELTQIARKKRSVVEFLLTEPYWLDLVQRGLKVRDIAARDKKLRGRIDDCFYGTTNAHPNWGSTKKIGKQTVDRDFLLSIASKKDIALIDAHFPLPTGAPNASPSQHTVLVEDHADVAVKHPARPLFKPDRDGNIFEYLRCTYRDELVPEGPGINLYELSEENPRAYNALYGIWQGSLSASEVVRNRSEPEKQDLFKAKSPLSGADLDAMKQGSYFPRNTPASRIAIMVPAG